MALVYIETSIPSYYFETRKAAKMVAWREATRVWWRDFAPAHSLTTSAATIAELGAAPAAKSRLMLDFVRPLHMLAWRSLVDEVAASYVENHLAPSSSIADAFHLAYCSIYSVNYLLTWNCAHLANPNKTRHLSVVNSRLGLATPIIVTPFQLLPEMNP